MKKFIIESMFWGIYFILPLIIKLILFLIENCISAVENEKKVNGDKSLTFYPSITILVSVGNCEENLRNCIDSILKQRYPLNKMQILLIENNCTDKSKDVFYEMQMQYPKLRIWWIDDFRGKGNSISKGIYMAEGKYIINIDCNGEMEENLINNFVYRFENDPKVSALSAVVVSDLCKISKNDKSLINVFQECRVLKQAEEYLVDKKFKSRINFLFDLSKDCSAFRKDAIFRACFNNGQSIRENKHIGSMIVNHLGGKISLEEDCLFYSTPIKSLSDLYEKKKIVKENEIKNFYLFGKGSIKTTGYLIYFSMLRKYGKLLAMTLYCFSMIYITIIKESIFIMLGMILFSYVLELLICFIGYIITKRTFIKAERFKTHLKANSKIIFFMPLCNFLESIISICSCLDYYMEKRNSRKNI